MGSLFTRVQRNGYPEYVPIGEPPDGKGYFIAFIRNELVDKINTLDKNGHWETELSERLEEQIEHFFATRAISISTPSGPPIFRPSRNG